MNLLDIYDGYLSPSNTERTILYYSGYLPHHTFFDTDLEDIQKFFERGEKGECITPEIQDYFGETIQGKARVKHVFSVYILGVYCYDNINNIKKSFNAFIENKIWQNTGEQCDSENERENRLRKDFLYLWYLTALYHDMGYLYETKGNNDNSIYTNIVDRKNIFADESLGNQGAVLGIPQKLRFSSNNYFWNRRNNIWFNDSLCVDHGFVGGMQLYKSLYKIHSDHSEGAASPTKQKSLAFGPKIFQWYNVPSAWAIICHNIWTAFEGTPQGTKYKELGLNDLVFPYECSPINYKYHPLLFLLDFIDTIDPIKRFCGHSAEIQVSNLRFIEANCNNNALSLTLNFNCLHTNSCYLCNNRCINNIEKDLRFLISSIFSVHIEENKISFQLN